MQLLLPRLKRWKSGNLVYKRLPIISSFFHLAKSRGLDKSLSRILKMSAVAASTCLALGHSPKEAKAQSKSPEASALQLGVPLLGPVPISFVPPHTICWKPGTPAAEVATYEKAHPASSVNSPFAPFRIGARLTNTATNGSGLKRGDAITVTYSFVPDGTTIPDPKNGENATQPSDLKAYLNGIYGSQAVWQNIFAQIGASLSAKTGLTYVYEPNDDGVPLSGNASGQKGVRGDVRISGGNFDGTPEGGSGGVLAVNYFPDFSDMIIDTSEGFFKDTSDNSLGLRNTVTHEFGHGLGLAHSCPVNETKLMEPLVSRRFDGPQLDDVLALQRSYGDPLEKQGANDTIGTATNLGTLNDGIKTQDTVSIDGSTTDNTNDLDYYLFNTAVQKSVSVRLTPTGAPFLTGSQNGDGSCELGTTYDPRSTNNLGFQLLAAGADGTFTTLKTVNDTSKGEAEVLDSYTLPGTGPFYVRVFGADDAQQAYALSLTIGKPGEPIPTPVPTVAPTPVPTPIRPVVDLNGRNSDGSTGQDSPNANGIDDSNVYAEGGGPQPVDAAPALIVLSDISKDNAAANVGAQLIEARVQIAPFASDPDRRAPDNRPEFTGLNRNDIEVLAVSQATQDILSGKTGRPASGLSFAYDNGTQILTIKGGTAPDFINNKLDFIRASYEIALRGVTYENKFFRGSTDKDLNRRPNLRNRFITFVVDTDNDAANNNDDRFAPQEPGNPKQSRPATETLIIGERRSLVVTTLNDVVNPQDDVTSLREAMTFANQDGKDSAITFDNARLGISDASPQTISLSRSLPFLQEQNQPITDPLPVIKTSITGPGPRLLNIRANGNRTFSTFGDSLTVTALSITGAGSSGIETSDGDLTVDRCMITGGSGDGIYSATFNGNNAAASVLTVTNSLIANNDANGIYTSNDRNANKTTTVTNSTISGNGLGISVNSHPIIATQNQGADPTTISLSTFTENQNTGIEANRNAEITITDTISYGNGIDDVDVTGFTNNGTNINGKFLTKDGNLVGAGNAVVQFTGAADQKGVDPLLAPLSNNGGDSDTHKLNAGSPARNAGVAVTGAPATDQRGTGFPRAVGTIDIGAYEAQEGNNPSFKVRITPRNPDENTVLTANATGTNDDGTAITPLFYRWLINGVQRQASTSNTFNLANRNVANNDVISVIVAQNEANANRANAPQATDSVTATVVVVNNPPRLTSVVLSPKPPTTNQTVTATATASDTEGDVITYTYVWKVNGQDVRTFSSTSRTDSLDLSVDGNGNRGDTVSVAVTATSPNGNNGTSTSGTLTDSTVVENSAPTVQNVAFNAPVGRQTQILLTSSDPDGDALTFAIVTAPTKGTAQISVNSDGRYVLYYTPRANATGTDTLTFRATDTNTAPTGSPSNAKQSNLGTATITITSTTPTPTPTQPAPTPTPAPSPTPTPKPNRPPVALSTSLNATREVPVSKGLAASDPDVGDVYSTLTLRRVSGPRKGTGEIRKDTDGTWKLFYKASGLYTGNDEVKFIAIDSKGAVSNVATITINLFNTAPTARSTQMQVAAGGSADVGIFGQDVDRDALTFKRVGGPTKGTGEFRKDANGNTRFFYQNSPAATGDDEVRFIAVDSNGKSSEIAILTIKVIGVFNRAPIANNVMGTTTRNTPVAVPVSASDPDDADLPEGQTTPLTFKRVGGPANGTGEIRLDNDDVYKMFYTPRAGFVGTETIRYVAIDDKGSPSAPATITITVTAPSSGSSALSRGSSPSAGSS